METNVRAKGPKAFIAKICAVLFLLIMIVFTLYPIVYTVLGSLKTNAELTAGGSFLPKSWRVSSLRGVTSPEKSCFWGFTPP